MTTSNAFHAPCRPRTHSLKEAEAGYGLSSRAYAHLLEDVADVNLRGRIGDDKGLCDLTVAESTREQLKHLHLARRKDLIGCLRRPSSEPCSACERGVTRPLIDRLEPRPRFIDFRKQVTQASRRAQRDDDGVPGPELLGKIQELQRLTVFTLRG